MKYTEQAVETLDDAGSVIANKNIEIEQLRQRVQELEKELEVEEKRFSDQWELLSSVTAERDKATQYWHIAEGRCDALMKQRNELLKVVEHIRRCIPIGGFAQIHDGSATVADMDAAIASVKEK